MRGQPIPALGHDDTRQGAYCQSCTPPSVSPGPSCQLCHLTCQQQCSAVQIMTTSQATCGCLSHAAQAYFVAPMPDGSKPCPAQEAQALPKRDYATSLLRQRRRSPRGVFTPRRRAGSAQALPKRGVHITSESRQHRRFPAEVTRHAKRRQRRRSPRSFHVERFHSTPESRPEPSAWLTTSYAAHVLPRGIFTPRRRADRSPLRG